VLHQQMGDADLHKVADMDFLEYQTPVYKEYNK
jgi:hypothetical protein